MTTETANYALLTLEDGSEIDFESTIYMLEKYLPIESKLSY